MVSLIFAKGSVLEIYPEKASAQQGQKIQPAKKSSPNLQSSSEIVERVLKPSTRSTSPHATRKQAQTATQKGMGKNEFNIV